MKRDFFSVWIAVVLLAAGPAAAVASEFTADFKQFTSWEEEDARDQSGKIYFKEGATRLEFVRGGEKGEILIVNPKKKKSWMLNALDKTYLEIRYTQKPWESSASRDGVTEKKTGARNHRRICLSEEPIHIHRRAWRTNHRLDIA